MQYLHELAGMDASADPGGCFLCDAAACRAPGPEATQRLVLLRSDKGVVLLNRYPYTNGHLLVACGEHLGDINALTRSQRAGLMELTALAQRLIETALNPQGFNIGINQGRCAGAGIPGHLHVHVVPRWGGDTNFMQVFGQVRVIPEALEVSHTHLAQTLEKMDRGDEATRRRRGRNRKGGVKCDEATGGRKSHEGIDNPPAAQRGGTEAPTDV